MIDPSLVQLVTAGDLGENHLRNFDQFGVCHLTEHLARLRVLLLQLFHLVHFDDSTPKMVRIVLIARINF